MIKLKPEFTFAGFAWPAYVAVLPKTSLAKRLTEFKKRRAENRYACTGPYYHAPTPDSTKDIGFYFESDFMPGLRWTWCDDVALAHIDHTGWYADEDQDSKFRGFIMRLPHGRGFLAGYTMGKGMISDLCTSTIHDSETDAANDADSMAENAAEREREYQAKERLKQDASDLEKELSVLRETLARLRLEHTKAIVPALRGNVRAEYIMRGFRAQLREQFSAKREELETALSSLERLKRND